MNVFTFLDYRALLHSVVEERKPFDPGFNYQRLASIAGVKKSYFSKVMNGKAELSQDQLFLIADYLGWSREEKVHAELLLELSRCTVPERKRELQTRIQTKRAKTPKPEAPKLSKFLDRQLPFVRAREGGERLLFAADSGTHAWLQGELNRIVRETKARVSKADTKELYELSIDLARFRP